MSPWQTIIWYGLSTTRLYIIYVIQYNLIYTDSQAFTNKNHMNKVGHAFVYQMSISKSSIQTSLLPRQWPVSFILPTVNKPYIKQWINYVFSDIEWSVRILQAGDSNLVSSCQWRQPLIKDTSGVGKVG